MSMLRSGPDGNLGERTCMIDAKCDTAIVPDAMNDLPNTEVSA
ncbi:hypothetical protein [Rhizobium sp. ZPR3]|jgi:hypothetical protein|uniref:Uncharacterized protein n=2 Tax=unclassified Rhizobium TaxID=2613769 RepID=A0AAU7SKU3_9HYPH